ncbi:MAG: phosphoglucosamine mutase, partial [Clostridia bacterium]|nr:phosphoglucosamine mutase [Clostridia bacterium]
MGKYFGTDGWRGVAGNDLCALDAFKIGRFLGGELKKRGGRAVIGKDTRRSSYMLEYAVASGIASAGATVYLLHVTTTACVSYIVTNEGFDLGIMISASH